MSRSRPDPLLARRAAAARSLTGGACAPVRPTHPSSALQSTGRQAVKSRRQSCAPRQRRCAAASILPKTALSRIGRARLGTTRFWPPRLPKFPAADRHWPSKPCRGERNFWMQRREAKIGLRDRKRHRRPEERNDTGENPHRNGLSRVGAGICGFVGLDGGVGSHMRTRLHGNSLLTGKLTGNFADLGAQARNFDEIVEGNQSLATKFPKKITGNFFDRSGNYESITGIRPCKLVSSRFGRDLFSRPSRNRRRATCSIGGAA